MGKWYFENKKGRHFSRPSFSILKPLRHVLAPHASQRIADLTQRDVILHTF